MNGLFVPSRISVRRFARMNMLAVVGLLFTACAGGPSDRSDAVKMADVLKGKTKQDLLACAGAPRSERTAQSLTTMVFQEEAELVELSVPGAKSSGPRDRPHRCRATITLQDDRVTEVQYESVPKWLGAENHCDEIFAHCSQ